MKHLVRIFVIILCYSLLPVSCEKEVKLERSKIIVNPQFAKDLLKKSSDTINIDMIDFFLEVSIYPDSMPGGSTEGNPLISTNCLTSIESLVVPQTIDLVKQYVIKNDSIWISLYEDEKEKIDSNRVKVCRTSINGPSWNPGILVDVVAEGYDSKNDDTFFIRALDQIINSK